MKKMLSLLLMVIIAGIVYSQEITKPAALENANIDSFVDDAFAIYDQTTTISTELDNSDAAITELEGNESPSADDIKIVSAKVKENKAKLEGLQNDAVALSGKSEQVLTGAKSISPKTKAPKAIKNVNTSIKVLNESKNKIPELLKKAADQEKRIEVIKGKTKVNNTIEESLE